MRILSGQGERVPDNEIKQPYICGLPTGYLALTALTIQMSALTFAARLSRTCVGNPYIVSVAVFMTECLKLAICLVATTLSFRMSHGRLPSRVQCLQGLGVAVSTAPPLLLPASLFTLQAGLNLYAATGLDAVTFQVTNQMKILPTAGFSTLFLQRKLSTRQLIALPLLAMGVACVHLSNRGVETGDVGRHNQDWWLGLVAAVCAAIFSGFASVRVEQLLKEQIWAPPVQSDPRSASPFNAAEDALASVSCAAPAAAGPAPGVGGDGMRSLVLVNVQLSFLGMLFATLQAVAIDGASLARNGLFHGFNKWAVANILLQAVGGLLVAYVVKYTDNIVKGFATALSIVMSLLLSCLFYGVMPASSFLFGVLLVILAFLLYAGAVTLPWAVTACLENPDPTGAILAAGVSAWDWLLCRDSGDKGRGGAAGASAGAAGLLGSLLGYHGVARVSVLVGLLFLGSLVVRGFTYGGSVGAMDGLGIKPGLSLAAGVPLTHSFSPPAAAGTAALHTPTAGADSSGLSAVASVSAITSRARMPPAAVAASAAAEAAGARADWVAAGADPSAQERSRHRAETGRERASSAAADGADAGGEAGRGSAVSALGGPASDQSAAADAQPAAAAAGSAAGRSVQRAGSGPGLKIERAAVAGGAAGAPPPPAADEEEDEPGAGEASTSGDVTDVNGAEAAGPPPAMGAAAVAAAELATGERFGRGGRQERSPTPALRQPTPPPPPPTLQAALQRLRGGAPPVAAAAASDTKAETLSELRAKTVPARNAQPVAEQGSERASSGEAAVAGGAAGGSAKRNAGGAVVATADLAAAVSQRVSALAEAADSRAAKKVEAAAAAALAGGRAERSRATQQKLPSRSAAQGDAAAASRLGRLARSPPLEGAHVADDAITVGESASASATAVKQPVLDASAIAAAAAARAGGATSVTAVPAAQRAPEDTGGSFVVAWEDRRGQTGPVGLAENATHSTASATDPRVIAEAAGQQELPRGERTSAASASRNAGSRARAEAEVEDGDDSGGVSHQQQPGAAALSSAARRGVEEDELPAAVVGRL